MHSSLIRKMLILNERQVQQCLLLSDCLSANRQAFVALAKGNAVVPARLGLPYHGGKQVEQEARQPIPSKTQDWTLFKPAAISLSSNNDNDWMGCKIVSVRENNPQKNLPLVPATILHMDAETGIVDAILDGTYLTAARTAAGSALATAIAWQGREVEHLILFGAGLQALLHVQFIAEALPQTKLTQLTIINRTLERAYDLQSKIQSMCMDGRIALETIERFHIVQLNDEKQVTEALSTASCVVTCTNTATPLFDGTDIQLPEGCHINSVGSYTPNMQEIPTETTRQQCRVWIDTPDARLVGDLKDLPTDHPITLLGDVLEQGYDVHSRNTEFPCTFYKSVGTAIQDVMTASIIVQKARELGIGTEVSMT